MSESSSSLRQCPKCGASWRADAANALCPVCLMAEAMQPTQAGDHAAPIPLLTPEELAPHFPQLEIIECLGRGGMGVVYKARQKSLNRLVALKLLAPERVNDAGFAERFQKEAHALAALNHPHIVTVHDFGRAGGHYFLLMEFVDGLSLRQLLRAKRLTPKEALAIVPPVCEALQCAHDCGIVHRDIKPENLLIDKSGKVKIADFGIAKIVARDSVYGLGKEESLAETRTTMPGTPDYAAPEQQDSSAATDHRADIYSLGVVLYEMLTGERPKDDVVPPSKRVQVDVRIDAVVLRALEKTPELRFATATEFRRTVEAAVAPTEARPRTAAFKKCVAIEVAGIVGVVALGVWCWRHHTGDTAHAIGGAVGLSAALLLFVFSVPMALRLTPRNAVWGFRLRESFESERRWDEINEHGGRRIMIWCCYNVALCAVSFFTLANNHETARMICILLSAFIPFGATYWWAVETNPRVPNPQTKRLLALEIFALILLVLQAGQFFVVQPYKVRTRDLAPELPAGTWRPLWKIGRPSEGEVVLFDHKGHSLLGRVLKVQNGKILVQRRNAEPMEAPLNAVAGRIVLGAPATSGSKAGDSSNTRSAVPGRMVAPAAKAPAAEGEAMAGIGVKLGQKDGKTVAPVERALYWVKHEKSVEAMREAVLEELVRAQQQRDLVNTAPGLSETERIQRAAPLDERIKALRAECEALRLTLRNLYGKEEP